MKAPSLRSTLELGLTGLSMVKGTMGSTRAKVMCAQIAFRMLRALRVSPHQRVSRRGVIFDLDLHEGIDLSLFLVGQFQHHVSAMKGLALTPNAVIFDVGANIGALSLNWARANPTARVFAFEPTFFAFDKLVRNIALNPNLQERVSAVQTFLSSTTTRGSVPDPYASWRVDDLGGSRHPVHLGKLKTATDRVTTMDQFVRERGLDRVDLVKIDTDGHELEVLRGGADTLTKHRPILVFEVGPYLLRERRLSFGAYEDLLLPLGYALTDARSQRAITSHSLERLAPMRGTIDVLALPQ